MIPQFKTGTPVFTVRNEGVSLTRMIFYVKRKIQRMDKLQIQLVSNIKEYLNREALVVNRMKLVAQFVLYHDV